MGDERKNKEGYDLRFFAGTYGYVDKDWDIKKALDNKFMACKNAFTVLFQL